MKLILLPGLDGTGKLFKPMLENIPAGFQAKTVAYPVDEKLGYAALEDFVAERLPDNESFAVLAESFSGPVGIRLARRAPKGLAAVILVATFAKNPMLIPGRLLSWTINAPTARRSVHPVIAKRIMLGPDTAPELLDRFIRTSMSLNAAVIVFRTKTLLTADVRQDLADAKVPMLYIQAARDRLIRSWNLKRIQKVKPDITVSRIDGPHMISQTRPAEVWTAVGSFLGSL